MAVDITTDSVKVDSIVLLALQAVWTGSPVGTLKLQASNDNVAWSDMESTEVAISGSGDTMYNLSTMGYSRLRVIYTATSGEGTLKIVANGKGI